MNTDNFNEQSIEQQRRRKAEQFRLNISENSYDSDSAFDSFDEDSELNSYSGQDVKEKMARTSKQVLKKRKREQKKELKNKNKRNRRAFRIMWLVSVVIVGVTAGVYIITGMNDMLAINRTDSSNVSIKLGKNPTLEDVTAELVKNGAIDEPSYFKMFANMTKAGDDFNQGTFEIRKNMDYEAIINSLQSSEGRATVSVTITEGQNVLEIAETLKEKGVLTETDEFLQLCASDTFDGDFDFLKAIDNADERYYKLEGYLYPDTYEFYVNGEAESAIYHMLNNYEAKITDKIDVNNDITTISKMVEKSDSGYSLDEVMRIASIIQAEAADKEDMYYISSILHNRLTASADMGVSNLGLDSTKFYPYRNAESVPDGNKDYTSRYDTYSKSGLPSGPICNPGMEAIKAALNPYDTGYYFFCHDKDGNAYYAYTVYEHNANLEYIDG